jgi:hypothetical protein
MLNFLKEKMISLEQLDNSINFIKSLEYTERVEWTNKIVDNVAGALQQIENNKIKIDEVINHFQSGKNEIIKELNLKSEDNPYLASFYISLVFFRAITISETNRGKDSLNKILIFFGGASSSVGKKYLYNKFGLDI